MKVNQKIYAALVILLIVASCSKKDVNHSIPPKVSAGVYSLNQGNYGANNTSLTYYDFSSSTATTDFYHNVNGFGLGDTGSDFIIYGGKIYIVMNNSGYVAVADALTAKFIDTIDFKNAGVNRGPENIIASGNKVFVSSTDGTVAVIDTTSLTVTKFITVGSNPAQMAIAGNNVYVSNTGAFGINYDSTLSVIDMGTLTETGKITVGLNPGSIASDNAGNLYVACTGDYNTVGPSMVKVSITSGHIVLVADTAAGVVRYYNNALYITGGYLGSPNIRVLSTTDFSLVKSNFVTDGTSIVTPYALDIDNTTGDVYVSDAKDYVASGTVFCFGADGVRKFSFSTSPTATPIKTVIVQR